MRDFSRVARNIVAIGRNYVAHAHELNNPLPKSPFYFLKPPASIITSNDQGGLRIEIPPNVGEVHHEIELAVIIGQTASRVKQDKAFDYVAGYAVAIDVTGRTMQDEAKSKGLPWSRAKGYDTWLPLGDFVDESQVKDPHNLELFLKVNNETRQQESTALMIFKIPALIEAVTDVITLQRGDIILTGTPAGVSRILPGDNITCGIKGLPGDPLQVKVVDRP